MKTTADDDYEDDVLMLTIFLLAESAE